VCRFVRATRLDVPYTRAVSALVSAQRRARHRAARRPAMGPARAARARPGRAHLPAVGAAARWV